MLAGGGLFWASKAKEDDKIPATAASITPDSVGVN
jgi:hypothetical protein